LLLKIKYILLKNNLLQITIILLFKHIAMTQLLNRNVMKYLALLSGIIFFLTSCSKDNPAANFEVFPKYCLVGDTIIFINQSSHGSTYIWSFGDNSSSVTSVNAKHVFSQVGDYTVTLNCIGTTNLQSSISKTISVKNIITEGIGISQVNLQSIWYNINKKFSLKISQKTDTLINGNYYHNVGYFNLGIVVVFSNLLPTVIDSSDNPGLIAVFDPYMGYTTKGVTVGDSIAKVERTYGSPGVQSGTDIVYYYDNYGVQFWTSSSSPLVEEIDVYQATNIQSAVVNEKLKKTVLNRREMGKFGVPQIIR